MKPEIPVTKPKFLIPEGEVDHKVAVVAQEELDKAAETAKTSGLRSVFLAHLEMPAVSGIPVSESDVTPETARIYSEIRAAVDSHGLIQTLIASGAAEDSINEARAAVVVRAFSVTSE